MWYTHVHIFQSQPCYCISSSAKGLSTIPASFHPRWLHRHRCTSMAWRPSSSWSPTQPTRWAMAVRHVYEGVLRQCWSRCWVRNLEESGKCFDPLYGKTDCRKNLRWDGIILYYASFWLFLWFCLDYCSLSVIQGCFIVVRAGTAFQQPRSRQRVREAFGLCNDNFLLDELILWARNAFVTDALLRNAG